MVSCVKLILCYDVTVIGDNIILTVSDKYIIITVIIHLTLCIIVIIVVIHPEETVYIVIVNFRTVNRHLAVGYGNLLINGGFSRSRIDINIIAQSNIVCRNNRFLTCHNIIFILSPNGLFRNIVVPAVGFISLDIVFFAVNRYINITIFIGLHGFRFCCIRVLICRSGNSYLQSTTVVRYGSMVCQVRIIKIDIHLTDSNFFFFKSSYNYLLHSVKIILMHFYLFCIVVLREIVPAFISYRRYLAFVIHGKFKIRFYACKVCLCIRISTVHICNIKPFTALCILVIGNLILQFKSYSEIFGVAVGEEYFLCPLGHYFVRVGVHLAIDVIPEF